MKVATMRRIDAWIGVPLCLCATGLQALKRLRRKPEAPAGRPRSVLVIKLSELGALIMLGPAMRALAEMAGRDNLHFLTFSESQALLQVMDYVPKDNIFVLRTGSPAQLARDAWNVLRRIRNQRIECSVDLDFFARATALIAWFCGCRRRIGCHAYFGEGPYRGNLLTHRVKFNPHIHVSRMFEILAQAAAQPAGGFPRIEFVPDAAAAPSERFKPAAEEIAGVRNLWTNAGVGPQHAVILLNTNISDREAIPLRKWADECYVALARLILAGIPDSFVLMTGTAKEAEVVARLEACVGHARCRSIAGKTSLRELLTLYCLADMMITNDSGPAHFATLTGMDAIVLFGPETPLLWRPPGPRVEILYRNLACSPCFSVYNGRQSKCRRNACMDFTPDEVYEAVRRRLASRKAAGSQQFGG
jgi:ADP-heptose:LPS heptosyltransferase